MLEPSPEPSAPRRILVVEDDEDLREAVTRTLIRAGFEAVVAGSGAAALAAARAVHPDAAIVDVFLPDSGGLGVARGLREAWGPVPILFVTGLGIAAVREALAPAPVLFKPFTRRQLLASLRRIAG